MLQKSIILHTFSTVKKGNTTLLVKDQYKESLSAVIFNMKTLDDRRTDTDAVKIGRGTYQTIPVAGNNGERLVVRNYRHGGLFGKLSGGVFYNKKRPVHEVAVNEIAFKNNVPSAEVVAIIKRRFCGLFYKADFVTREITDAVDLVQLITESSLIFIQRFKRPIIRALAKLVRNMHDAGIFHADLHLKNILVKHDADGEFHSYIIDLDKSVVAETLNINQRIKNLRRLDRSIEKLRWVSSKTNTSLYQKMSVISQVDKIRFFRLYMLCGNALDKDWKRYILKRHSRHVAHKLWWHILRYFHAIP